MALPGVDAAIVSLEGEKDQPRTMSASGMTLEQAERQVFAAPPDIEAHAMSISYKYADGGDGQIRSALVLPLHGESAQIGYLAAYSRARERKPGHRGRPLRRAR